MNIETFINKLNNIMKDNISTNQINNIIKKTNSEFSKLNNSTITCQASILHMFTSIYDGITKLDATDIVNSFTQIYANRTSYLRKEQKIPYQFYQKLESNVRDLCNNYINSYTLNNPKIVGAIDGCNNNDSKYKVSLNMGYFNISNDMPIAFTLEGNENRNKEISCAKEYISNHLHSFDNIILVLDRFYYCFNFIEFLIQNNIKFIIKVKGHAKNFDPNNKSKKLNDNVLFIKENTRIVNLSSTYEKTLYTKNTKKHEGKQYFVQMKSQCMFITNLYKTYSNEDINNLYKSRWEIESFFKLIKKNFNIQLFKRRNNDEMKKVHPFVK